MKQTKPFLLLKVDKKLPIRYIYFTYLKIIEIMKQKETNPMWYAAAFFFILLLITFGLRCVFALFH